MAFGRNLKSLHEFYTQIRHFLYDFFGYFYSNKRYLIKQSLLYHKIVMYDLAVIFAFEIITHKTVIASTKQNKF